MEKPEEHVNERKKLSADACDANKKTVLFTQKYRLKSQLL